MKGDSILWVSLALIVVVILTRYRPILAGMLFTPGYFGSAGITGTSSIAPVVVPPPTGGPTSTATGATPKPGVNFNPSTGTGL